jgi:hypothetical protein
MLLCSFAHCVNLTVSVLGDKGSRCTGLTTLPLSHTDSHELWEPQPPGTLRACPDLHWDSFASLLCIFNLLNAELDPICHLLALLGVHPILHVSRVRVNKTQNTNNKNLHVYVMLLIGFPTINFKQKKAKL